MTDEISNLLTLTLALGEPSGERVALSFALILMLLIFGVVALWTMDHFRDRIKKYHPLLWFNSRTTDQRANLCAELSEAVRAKLGLDTFFDSLAHEYHGRLVEPLRQIAVRMRYGMTLSDALDESRVLPPHAISAIRATESGGGALLSRTLTRISIELREEFGIAWRIRTALLYPLFIWLILLVVEGFLSLSMNGHFAYLERIMKTRVPFFLVIDEQNEYEFCSFFFILIGTALILNWWWSAFAINRRIAARIHAALPFFGARLKARCLARCAHALSVMVESDMPLHTACRHAADPALSGPFAQAFEKIAQALERGEAAPAAFKSFGLPDTWAALIAPGVAGCALPQAFDTLAEIHESRARRLENIFVAALPLVTIPLTGVAVAVVYGSVFQLIQGVRDNIINSLRIMH